MRILGIILKAALVAYLVIFAVLNTSLVELKFFFNMSPLQMPIFLLVILIGFIGLFLGVFLMLIDKLSANSDIKRLKKELNVAQVEINRLKNINIVHEDKPAVSEVEPEKPLDIKDVLR